MPLLAGAIVTLAMGSFGYFVLLNISALLFPKTTLGCLAILIGGTVWGGFTIVLAIAGVLTGLFPEFMASFPLCFFLTAYPAYLFTRSCFPPN